MPKPINKTIGQVLCPYRDCECQADVKREKNHERGALYAVCPTHGRISTNGAKYKDALAAVIEKGMATPGKKPEPKPEPKPAPKPVPVPAQPAPDQGGPGFLESANNQLAEFWK